MVQQWRDIKKKKKLTWLHADARRKMILIHDIDVPKLDELSAQIDKNEKKGTKKVTKYPRSGLSIHKLLKRKNRFFFFLNSNHSNNEIVILTIATIVVITLKYVQYPFTSLDLTEFHPVFIRRCPWDDLTFSVFLQQLQSPS